MVPIVSMHLHSDQWKPEHWCWDPVSRWLVWVSGAVSRMRSTSGWSMIFIRKVDFVVNAESMRLSVFLDGTGDEESSINIYDARSYTCAQLNRVKGGGMEFAEYYCNSHVEFLHIPNMHTVRSSFESLSKSLLECESDKYVEFLEWLYLGTEYPLGIMDKLHFDIRLIHSFKISIYFLE